ncbi:MAG: MraY family glycosyltransferase [Bacillota bacterium]|nr:MraY family glycosyltransferase [Bacillota bacterium]HOL51954.1 MraY family glycosyltransferase [Bacillota bacterium]HOO30805.1 MraY family glycosyltransferase [Bacillota bacterium]HPQ02632.1 MraY family glycosyltransferase [Bacillota bacterium]HPZ13512.1 MraY family glycosyltransferase [Bacillota bacterium]
MNRYLMSFLFTIASSFLLTPQIRAFALKRGIVDRPRGRHVHKAPVPMLGGVAIYLSFAAACLIFTKVNKNAIGLLLGGGLIVAFGVWDDICEIKPRTKLCGQIAAAVVLVLFGVKIEFVTNPLGGMIYLGFMSVPLTIIWLVAFMNVVNFIDGLDGLAAGVSAIGALAMAFAAFQTKQGQLVIMSMALAGSALGFLYYNFNPASIFMGDAGAMFLGFAIAGISAMGALKTPATLALAVPVLVMGVAILDTAFAIFRRVRKGAPVSVGDKDHVHHRLLAMGMTQREAVLTLYAVSGLLAAAACGIVVVNPRVGLGGAVVAFGALIIVGEKSGVMKVGPRRKMDE